MPKGGPRPKRKGPPANDVPIPSKIKDLKPEDLTLDDVDKKMLKIIYEHPQLTQVEIAKLLGVSRSTVQNRYAKLSFQKAIADMHASTFDILKKAQRAAMQTLMRLATQRDDNKIALDAAKWLTQPMLAKAEINVNEVKEIIYSTRIAEGGILIKDKEIIENPKDTLELLQGKKVSE